jgi:hypothetical protein
MGKIEISDDLRSKLDKVLSYKSADIGDTAVGPAPSWKPPAPNPPQPPQQPLQQPPQPPPQQLPQHQQMPYLHQPQQQPHQQIPPPQYYYVKPEKNKKKKDKIKYYKITKIVFLSSVVAGIGMTLGLKIANILFF